jgi:multiple sugar transport system substrate-binding protein
MTEGRSLSRRGVLTSGAGALALPLIARRARAQGTPAKPSGLNMLYATVEADSDAIKLVLPDFQREFGFAVHLDTMPYNSLQQKVFAELASGSSYYDIMIVDTPWMPALTHKIQPLTGMILDRQATDPAALDIGDFIPKVFFDTAVYKPDASYLHWPGGDAVDPEAIKRAGFEIYGLPIQANALVLAYRRDLFANPAEQQAFKAKYNRDLAVPVAWEQDFTPVAAFFTRPAKRLWGTTLMAGAGDWATDDFKTLLACFGGNGHMIDDKLQVVFDTPPGVAALTYYVDLIRKYKVTPPGTTSASWDTAATEFSTGLTAMSMNYHTETLSPMAHGEIGYAMVPKQVQYGPHFGTWMLSVNSFSKNKDWAWRAIQWFTGKPAQEKMLATQLHPTRRSVFDVARKDPALTRKFGNFYEVLGKSLEVGVGRPRLTNYSDVDRAIWVAVNNAATGAEQPGPALAKARQQVERLLKEAGYVK